MRRFLLLTTFLVVTPLLLAVSLYYFSYLAKSQSHLAQTRPQFAYAALPKNQNVFGDEVTPADSRVEILRQFFDKYNSPLLPHADVFVAKAEEYDLDFRLLPAIAMQESNLCTKSRPGTHNCWGFGVYGDKYLAFKDYPEAIDTVTKTLAVKYRDKHGLVTPDEIVKMYTPSSNGSWQFSVNHFMESME